MITLFLLSIMIKAMGVMLIVSFRIAYEIIAFVLAFIVSFITEFIKASITTYKELKTA